MCNKKFFFSYVSYVHVHTFKVLFNLFNFVIYARNKHTPLNTLYEPILVRWWRSDVMWASKTGPLAWEDTCHEGTRMVGPNGVPSSQVSLYIYNLSTILTLEICDFPHPNFSTSLHEQAMSSTFMTWSSWTLCSNQ